MIIIQESAPCVRCKKICRKNWNWNRTENESWNQYWRETKQKSKWDERKWFHTEFIYIMCNVLRNWSLKIRIKKKFSNAKQKRLSLFNVNWEVVNFCYYSCFHLNFWNNCSWLGIPRLWLMLNWQTEISYISDLRSQTLKVSACISTILHPPTKEEPSHKC